MKNSCRNFQSWTSQQNPEHDLRQEAAADDADANCIGLYEMYSYHDGWQTEQD